MEKLSGLSKIENLPENPFDLFERFLEDYKKYTTLPIVTMNLASINKQFTVLNRTVIFRGIFKDDDDGQTIAFVTERNTQKYKDFQENPNVAVTLLFLYTKNDENITEQIRINGTVIELPDDQIEKFWNEELTYSKIRSLICECGAPIEWDELKAKHDKLIKDYEDGKIELNRNKSYTAFKIVPSVMDFYHAFEKTTADRVKYTRDNETNSWIIQRLYT